jgi:hypothetical protein
VFAGRESLFMVMYLSVVAWSSIWFRALISVCEGLSGGITWAAAAAWWWLVAGSCGLRRATTTVDEASLSPATLRGVVVPAPAKARGGRREDESEGEIAVVHSWGSWYGGWYGGK